MQKTIYKPNPIADFMVLYMFRNKNRTVFKTSHAYECIHRLKERFPSVEYINSTGTGEKYSLAAADNKKTAEILNNVLIATNLFDIADDYDTEDKIFTLKMSWNMLRETIVDRKRASENPVLARVAKFPVTDWNLAVYIVHSVLEDFYK